MSMWQQQFAERMEELCAQSSGRFDNFSTDVLEPAYESVSSFVSKWHYDSSQVPCDGQRRTYRFGLTEDGYLLIWFRLEGFDTIECEYEYALPGTGRVAGVRTTGSLREADQAWAESCFQMALNSFVSRFIEQGRRAPTPAQPVLVCESFGR